MARKRGAKGRFVKGSGKGGGKRRRRYRKNPGMELALANPSGGRIRHYARRGARAAGGFLGNLGVGSALKAALPLGIGIVAASLIRKKFGSVGDQRDNWEWKDYLMAGLGTIGAAVGARHLFRASAQTSQMIMLGGLGLIITKILQDEIVPQSDTLKNWIGEEEAEGAWAGLGQGDQPAGYLPGDLYMGDDGETFVYGEDGNWRNVDESARMLGAAGLGEEPLRSPTNLGDPMVRPGSLGGADPFLTAYRR